MSQKNQRNGPDFKKLLMSTLRTSPNLSARELADAVGETPDVVRWHLKEMLETNDVKRRYRESSGPGLSYEYTAVRKPRNKPSTDSTSKWKFPSDLPSATKPAARSNSNEVTVRIPVNGKQLEVSVSEASEIFNKLKPFFDR